MKKNKEDKVLGYKIRHSKTKLYLSSPYKMKWSKVGKTWPRMCDVVRTINYGMKYFKNRSEYDPESFEHYTSDMMSWNIIELKETNSYSIAFLINRIK